MKITKTFVITTLALCSVAIFASCGAQNTSTEKVADSTVVENSSSCTGKIAYVRMDSLMGAYGMYMDLGTEFAKKQEKASKELENKARSLENEVRDFQEKAQKGLITTYQGRTKQEELAKKEQNIRVYQEQKMRELAEEEAVIGSKISAAILDYLKEYNAEKGYSMILQSMGGNPVILADSTLDITEEVLAELNKRYEATLSSK